MIEWPVTESFADWVKQARGFLGLSQEGLAERLDIHRVTVARWETGTAEPNLRQRRALQELVDYKMGCCPVCGLHYSEPPNESGGRVFPCNCPPPEKGA